MRFQIPREKWLRGEGSGESFLLRGSDEKMCCVGIYIEQLGIPREELLDKMTPCSFSCEIPKEARWLVQPDGKGGIENTSLALDLYIINDSRDITEEQREAKVKALFAENGVEVEFV
jgi:hypothetical protein